MEEPRGGGPSLKRPVPPIGGAPVRRSPGRVLPLPPRKSSSRKPAKRETGISAGSRHCQISPTCVPLTHRSILQSGIWLAERHMGTFVKDTGAEMAIPWAVETSCYFMRLITASDHLLLIHIVQPLLILCLKVTTWLVLEDILGTVQANSCHSADPHSKVTMLSSLLSFKMVLKVHC